MGWDGLIVYSISNDQNITLSVVPSVEDVKNTLFSFINEKSPSPNGTTLSVYKAYWPIVGEVFIYQTCSTFLYSLSPLEDFKSHLYYSYS